MSRDGVGNAVGTFGDTERAEDRRPQPPREKNGGRGLEGGRGKGPAGIWEQKGDLGDLWKAEKPDEAKGVRQGLCKGQDRK